ncbi:hypothetical protein VW35_00955 [Devosia soli]|uniref:GapR-like DNA-binding domain-containing protein n=1 Tax=Devosia soli TaxID=361041 RepID=A0A0F5LEU1_9HYPH|nr:DUF2312 domain-containing protein [Devosia soli]KKB80810.1 hypothetical protein VW35_00955 [Devosia soli]
MSDNVAGEELRQFIERCERLDEERKAISDDIKEVKAEAKSRGFDVRIINMILRLRRMDENERMEQDALLDLYMSHLGMLPPGEDE